MSLIKSSSHQSSLRGTIPYIRKLQKDGKEWLVGFIRHYAPQDIWAVTLEFGYQLRLPEYTKRRTDFIKRLQQGQRDSGGGELLFLIVTALQQRGVVHYHMMVLGEGLGKLPKDLWVDRWKKYKKRFYGL